MDTRFHRQVDVQEIVRLRRLAIGQAIGEYRRQLDLSQAALSERLYLEYDIEVTQQAISGWERGVSALPDAASVALRLMTSEDPSGDIDELLSSGFCCAVHARAAAEAR